MQRLPEKETEVLDLVGSLLAAGKGKDATELLRRYGLSSAELRNAYGVALLRTGEITKALEVFRSLVVNESGVCMRQDVPALYKVNFATALLLNRNVSGCAAALREVAPQEPAGVRLRVAISRWERTLNWWSRLMFRWYGAEPAQPVPLDFPPGELLGRQEVRPAA